MQKHVHHKIPEVDLSEAIFMRSKFHFLLRPGISFAGRWDQQINDLIIFCFTLILLWEFPVYINVAILSINYGKSAKIPELYRVNSGYNVQQYIFLHLRKTHNWYFVCLRYFCFLLFGSISYFDMIKFKLLISITITMYVAQIKLNYLWPKFIVHLNV